MLSFIKDRIDYFFGRGRHSIFVPVMDGPLKPNEFLDNVQVILEKPEVDNLILAKNKILCSSGADLLVVEETGNQKILYQFDSDITSMSANKNNGEIAVALLEGKVVICSIDPFREKKQFKENCVTSMTFNNELLMYTKGSDQYLADKWKNDLMSLGETGSILINNLDGNPSKKLFGNLLWPSGIALISENIFCVSEAWSHRVSFFDFNNTNRSISNTGRKIEKLPAYPGRLFFDTKKNELWVTFFAPRNQLVEFILTEDEYRNRMVDEIEASLWVSPCYRSGKQVREPLQQSGIKTMGYLKPWAPAFSYGLVVNFDMDLNALSSFHSRTNGSFHGTTSMAIDNNNRILVTSRGDGKIGAWK